jgi:hypothetical protein
VDQILEEERRRLAELVAVGAPPWKLHQEINRSGDAMAAVVAPRQPVRREPVRAALRLSLAEREEISRGLAAGLAVRAIARGPGRAPSTVCWEVVVNGRRDRSESHGHRRHGYWRQPTQNRRKDTHKSLGSEFDPRTPHPSGLRRT